MSSFDEDAWAVQQKVITVLSGISVILTITPLTWLIHSRNIGCVLFAFWIAGQCFASFVNDIIWSDNTRVHALAWCDLWVWFDFASNLGVLSAGLVVARRVSILVSNLSPYISKGERRRQVIEDLAIGLIPPLSQVVEYYFLRGHRMDIYEGIGCLNVEPRTIILICLTSIWEPIIAFISAYYCIKILHALYKRHQQIKAHLAASAIDLQQFYRLVVMAVVEMCCMVPLCIWSLITDVDAYVPWKGWADFRSDAHVIKIHPVAVWMPTGDTDALINQWYSIGCAILFFLVFGSTRDAVMRYKRWLGLGFLSHHLNKSIRPAIESHISFRRATTSCAQCKADLGGSGPHVCHEKAGGSSSQITETQNTISSIDFTTAAEGTVISSQHAV